MEYPLSGALSDLAKNKSEIILCPECKGEGILTRRKFFGHTEGWHSYTIPCPVCKGKRAIRMITRCHYETLD